MLVWTFFLPLQGLRAQSKKANTYETFNKFYLQGVYHYIRRENDLARNDLIQATRLNDSVGAPYFYLALVERASGNTQAAAEYLDKACALDPERAKTYRKYYADTTGRNKEKNTTAPSAQSIAKDRDADDFVKRHRSFTAEYVWQKGNEYVEKYPFRPRLVYITAEAGKKLKKYDEAIRLLENGMDFAAMEPDLYPDYVRLLVELYELTGQKAKADKYRKLIQKHK